MNFFVQSDSNLGFWHALFCLQGWPNPPCSLQSDHPVKNQEEILQFRRHCGIHHSELGETPALTGTVPIKSEFSLSLGLRWCIALIIHFKCQSLL